MTVASWGEDPRGVWSVTIQSDGELTATEMELLVFGTADTPVAMKRILRDQCHPECRGGCAQEGAEFCDDCLHYRVNSSRECVEECPAGTYAEHDVCWSCDPVCLTCTGPGATSCSTCSPDTRLVKGQCLADEDQVDQATTPSEDTQLPLTSLVVASEAQQTESASRGPLSPITHSMSLAVIPDSVSSTITPDSASSAVTPDSASSVVTPDSASSAVTPDSESSVVTPDSASSAVTPDSESSAVTPDSESSAITPDSESSAVTPDSASSAIVSEPFPSATEGRSQLVKEGSQAATTSDGHFPVLSSVAPTPVASKVPHLTVPDNPQLPLCEMGCLQCTSPQRCLVCGKGMVLLGDKCVGSCGEGHAQVMGRCVPCIDSHCSRCENSLKCDICVEGYYLSSFGLCQECDKGCVRCTGKGACLECSEGATACEQTVEGHQHRYSTIVGVVVVGTCLLILVVTGTLISTILCKHRLRVGFGVGKKNIQYKRVRKDLGSDSEEELLGQ